MFGDQLTRTILRESYNGELIAWSVRRMNGAGSDTLSVSSFTDSNTKRHHAGTRRMAGNGMNLYSILKSNDECKAKNESEQRLIIPRTATFPTSCISQVNFIYNIVPKPRRTYNPRPTSQCELPSRP